MLVFYVCISKQVPKLTVRKIFFGVFALKFFFKKCQKIFFSQKLFIYLPADTTANSRFRFQGRFYWRIFYNLQTSQICIAVDYGNETSTCYVYIIKVCCIFSIITPCIYLFRRVLCVAYLIAIRQCEGL